MRWVRTCFVNGSLGSVNHGALAHRSPRRSRESDTMQGLSPRAQGRVCDGYSAYRAERGQKPSQSFLSASTLLRFLMPYPVLTATP